MAEEIGVQLKVRDQAGFSRELGAARRDVRQFGDATGSAAVSVGAASRRMGVLQRTTGIVRSGFRAALPASLALAGAIGLGAGGLAFAARTGVQEFIALDKVQQQTRAGIKSTGGVANVTAKEVRGLSERLESVTTVDENLIQSGQNVLLTFTKIRDEVGKGNNIFERATKSALDLSIRLGTDMSSTSIQLGKALNDPIKGVTALGRAGVQFTEQQREQIATMVESGNILGAQKMILKELETQVGGSAKAYGDSFEGSINRVKDVFGDLARSVVGQFEPQIRGFLESVTGAVDRFASALERGGIKEALKEIFPDWLIDNIPIIAGAIAGALVPAVVALGVSIAGALAPLLPFIAAGALLALVITNWGEITEWFGDLWHNVWNGVTRAFGEALGWVIDKIAGFVDFWFAFADKILAGAEFAFGWVPGIGDKISEARDDFQRFGDTMVRELRRSADAARRMGNETSDALRKAREQWDSFEDRVTSGAIGIQAAFSYVPPALENTGQTASGGSRRRRPIGAMADGGRIQAHVPYLVGERGPELRVFDRPGEIIPNHELATGGVTLVMHNPVIHTQAKNGRELLAELQQAASDRAAEIT